MKKLPFIIGIATATASAFTGAMVSLDHANAVVNEDTKPVDEKPIETKKSINSLVVNDIADQTYTGEAITPAVFILDAQKQLELGTDYSLEYAKNTNAGIADVLITGKGQYDGAKTIHFNIIKATNSWEIEPDIETMSVGKPKFGEVRLFIKASGADDSTYIEMIIDEEEGIYPSEDDEEALMEFFYGGQAIVCKIVVDGNDNYAGLEKLFAMTVPYSITVQGIQPVEYSGNAIEPAIIITNDDTNEQLTLGVDYTVSYSNNINVGTATATITFIGNYAENEPIEKTFEITPAQAQVLDYQFDNGKIVKYTGSEQEVTLPTSYSIGELKTVILQSGSLDLTEEYEQYYNDALNYNGMNEEEARQYAEEQLQYSWQLSNLDSELYNYYESDYSNIQLNKTWNGKIVDWTITGEKQEYIVGNDVQVTSVGTNAFYNNFSIVTLNVPNNITFLEMAAFCGMSNLQYINLPANLAPCENMFANCYALTSFSIPENWTIIPYACFANTNLNSITIGNNITQIDGHAFANCQNLSQVNLPSTLISIGSSAFSNCPSLSNIILPSSLLQIGHNAFSYTNLEEITIPVGVTHLTGLSESDYGQYEEFVNNNGYSCMGPFVNCSNLKRISLLNNSEIVVLGGLNDRHAFLAFGENSQNYEDLVIYVPSELLDSYKARYTDFLDIISFKAIGDTSVNVSITSSNNTAGTVTQINSVGAIDDVITFSATANSGYYFSHWIKNGSTMIYDDTLTITLTGKDVSYEAYFVAGSKETVNGYNITANGGIISVGADSITITAIDTTNFVYWKHEYRNLGEQTTLTIPFSEINSDMIIVASDGFIQETIIDFSSDYDSNYSDLINQGKTAEEATTLTQDYINQLYGTNGTNLSMYFSLYEYDDVHYVCDFDWTNKTVTVKAYGKANGYY